MSPSNRDRRNLKKKRLQGVTDAATERQQASAQAKDPETLRRARHRTRRRRTLISRALFAGGVVVGLQHLGFHLAGSPSPLSDVLVGYPSAGALIVGGAFALPTSSTRRR